MQPTNNTGKGYTDEQWESLLNQTFGESSPAITVTPDPEIPDAAGSAPTVPITQKSRRLGMKLWLAISASFAVLAASLCAVLLYRDAPTKEHKQCMEALRQWQSAEYYKLDTTINHINSENYIVDSEHILVQYNDVRRVYYRGGENNLIWSYYQNWNETHYEGIAQIGEDWFSYSSGGLDPEQWKSAGEMTPSPAPWILSFSLDEVHILDLQHKVVDGVFLYTFLVKDTDPSADLYGQGPYYVQFRFQEDMLQSVGRYLTDTTNHTLTVTQFHLQPMTEDVILTTIQSQLMYPQRIPGLFFSSSVIVPKTQE